MGQPVMQWQILAKNPDRAMEFYRELFGWQVNTDNAMGYRQVHTGAGSGIDGGIWPAPPEGHSMVSLYVQVEDIAQAVGKAQTLGASVIISPQKLPDGDEMAVILDPEGISFGLFKPR